MTASPRHRLGRSIRRRTARWRAPMAANWPSRARPRRSANVEARGAALAHDLDRREQAAKVSARASARHSVSGSLSGNFQGPVIFNEALRQRAVRVGVQVDQTRASAAGPWRRRRLRPARWRRPISWIVSTSCRCVRGPAVRSGEVEGAAVGGAPPYAHGLAAAQPGPALGVRDLRDELVAPAGPKHHASGIAEIDELLDPAFEDIGPLDLRVLRAQRLDHLLADRALICSLWGVVVERVAVRPFVVRGSKASCR